MKPTVSLQMIIKDEVEQVTALVVAAAPYLDKANITATTKPAYERLKEVFKDTDDVSISYFRWIDDFAAARNYNLEQCDSDYFFWVDADDEFDFSTVPDLVTLAAKSEYDVIYLPYIYAQDELGNTITEHYRERLVRTEAGFEWRGIVHENLLRDTTFRAKKLDQPVVIHHATDPEASKLRNHQILEAQVAGKEPDDVDPRDLHYLGISYFALGQYENAINTLEWYVQVGGWDEEIYRSLIKISEAYFMLDAVQEARENALRASSLLPHYPDAYFTLARYEYATEAWAECLEWLEVAFSKPKPKTMSIQNPQVYDIGRLQAATCMFSLKQFVKAYKYLGQVPDYLKADVEPMFKHEASKELFVTEVSNMIESGFVNPDLFYGALTRDMQYDVRLRPLRNSIVSPTNWNRKTIVFYCGQGYEEWGAHTLGKGMGGSEEAVVYLSRELTRRGYQVTIYGSVTKPMLDQGFDMGEEASKLEFPGVHYLPHQEFDPRDTFNVLVLWRAPALGKKLNARVKIIDMHDVLPAAAVQPRDDATYFVKSQFQRNLYPDLPDEQFHVIGNGIVTDQFKGAGEIAKREGSVGYFSSYYRGLETLVDLWPEIRKQAIERGVQYPTLDIAYGWGSYTAFQGEDEFYHRMNAKLAALGTAGAVDAHTDNRLEPEDEGENLGVYLHDRLSHDDLAKLMLETQVWAYPTEFPETHCITALKAQEALCYPVTTTVAALDETVQSGVKLDTAIIYSNEYEQKKFIKEVVDALVEKKTGTPVPGADWSFVADDWIKFIEGK